MRYPSRIELSRPTWSASWRTVCRPQQSRLILAIYHLLLTREKRPTLSWQPPVHQHPLRAFLLEPELRQPHEHCQLSCEAAALANSRCEVSRGGCHDYVYSVPFSQKHRSLPHGSTT